MTGRIYVSPHVRFVEDEFPGLTMSAGGTEQVIPSFADGFVPGAPRVDENISATWYPIQSLPGTGPGTDDVVRPADFDEHGAPAPTAAERRAATAPPPGQRVADRLPRRGARANTTEVTDDGAMVYRKGLDPIVPFVLLLGSGTRPAR